MGASIKVTDIGDETTMDELMEIGVLTTTVTFIDGDGGGGFNRKRQAELLAV